MEQVSVIGLGLMGSALAEALLRARLSVTVWNRTASRCTRFETLGARVASTAASAVAVSEVLLVCLSNYTATEEVLEARDVRTTLKGKTLIQLSSGTPQEAREAAARARELGTRYLDGAILAYPSHMG